MSDPAVRVRFSRRQLALLGLLVIGLYVLLPQLADFRASWHLLRHPKLGWSGLALTFSGLSYLAAAATYCLLAFKTLSYWRTVLAQLAIMFVNRLLPGGIGALGASYAYLRRQGQSTTQAGTLVAINNLLGIVGHGLLLALALLVTEAMGKPLSLQTKHPGLIISLGLALAAFSLLAIGLTRAKVRRVASDVLKQLSSYQQRPGRLLAALGSSMVLTSVNILSFYCSALALGVHLPLTTALLIFSFGVGVGTATPTPGGLGGFEAGLVGGLAAYNVAGATALAIALLYRLISYWLPLVAGAVAFTLAQKKHLFKLAV